jgi:hypothetical protein
MKSRLIYGVIVLGFCAAVVTVVGLRLSPTVGMSSEHAAMPETPTAHTARPQFAPAARQRVLERYARMPLRFEAPPPQKDAVRFVARGSGYELFLMSTEAVWAFGKGKGARQELFSGPRSLTGAQSSGFRLMSSALGFQPSTGADAEHSSRDTAVVRMKLVGANPTARMLGRDQLPGRLNYYLGNDPKKWRTNVPAYAKVHYQGVYPGVDLVLWQPAATGIRFHSRARGGSPSHQAAL